MSEGEAERPRTTAAAPRRGASDPIYPSQALAENLRGFRRLRRLSQQDVAERMTALGYGRPGKPGGRKAARARAWSRSTTGEVESGKREVTVDEFVGLCIILGVTPGELLDPGEASLSLGTVPLEGEPPRAPLRPRFARPFVRSDIGFELTEHMEGLRLRLVEVAGRRDEYLEAMGVDHVGREPVENEEDR